MPHFHLVLEDDRVFIDGVQYVPWNKQPETPSPWQLTPEHFNAARALTRPVDALEFAVAAQASVDEMLAYAMREWAECVSPPAGNRKKVAPLPVPPRTSKKLF